LGGWQFGSNKKMKIFLLVTVAGVLGQDELEDYTATLCADKRNEELFRLQTGETNCRDVVQCTDSVNLEFLFLS